ncbi:MAG: polysaccharide deacetylase [Erysipelotrichales bacterium]|nr:polysaccharide deacetylase [Erysipelotrichales bacterium]
MAKRVKTKREKRLQQLMTLIIVAIVSCILNLVLMVGGSFTYFSMKDLKEDFATMKEEYSERTMLLESYISQLTYEKSQLLEEEEPVREETNVNEVNYDTGKIAYLTFDDGPTDLTPKVLDVLAEYNVKATFFIKGVMIKYHPDLLNRIVEEGHTLGNHTVTHKYEEIYTSTEALKAEILENNRRILEQTGVVVTAFRFPGGSSNSMFATYSDEPLENWLNLIDDLGMEYYDWNVSSLDATGTLKTPDEIYNAVISGCGNSSQVTVLMHDVNTNTSTLEALPRIIETLQEMGYSIQPITSTSKPVQHRTVQ